MLKPFPNLRQTRVEEGLLYQARNIILGSAADAFLSSRPPIHFWGGGGGSVGLGHCNVTPPAANALRSQDLMAGAEQYLRDRRLALGSRMFQRDWSDWARDLPRHSVASELAALECPDPGRNLYVFRLENDQRRHVYFHHYENLNLLPLELVDPLLDPEILAVVCRMPLDWCFGHKMYHQWVARFADDFTKVPWQTYPGHEACPVPLPAIAVTQWEVRRRKRRVAPLSAWIAGTKGTWRAMKYGRRVLRPDIIAAAYASTMIGADGASYLVRQSGSIVEALAAAHGRISPCGQLELRSRVNQDGRW